MHKPIPRPWTIVATGAGLRIDAANKQPVLFIYGMSSRSQKIAEAIIDKCIVENDNV